MTAAGARWSLGLPAWVIQDGNYPDIEAGRRIEVAIEFAFEHVESVEHAAISRDLLDECRYDLTARVLLAEPDVWVIDAGVSMYSKQPAPAGITVGATVRGSARVHVDPYMYFERLAHDGRLPAMIYGWQVHRIARAARFVSGAFGWTTVDRTDAWDDDHGGASYVLECELLDEPPKRTSVTAL